MRTFINMENETAVVLVYKELETVASMWSDRDIYDSGMVCVELDKIPLCKLKHILYYLSIDTTYITNEAIHFLHASGSKPHSQAPPLWNAKLNLCMRVYISGSGEPGNEAIRFHWYSSLDTPMYVLLWYH